MKHGVFSSSDTCPCCHCFVLITDNFNLLLDWKRTEDGKRQEVGVLKGREARKTGKLPCNVKYYATKKGA